MFSKEHPKYSKIRLFTKQTNYLAISFSTWEMNLVYFQIGEIGPSDNVGEEPGSSEFTWTERTHLENTPKL